MGTNQTPQKRSKGGVPQSKLFIEKARELGCDDDPATFDKMLKKIASAPPPKSVQKRKTKRAAKRRAPI